MKSYTNSSTEFNSCFTWASAIELPFLYINNSESKTKSYVERAAFTAFSFAHPLVISNFLIVVALFVSCEFLKMVCLLLRSYKKFYNELTVHRQCLANGNFSSESFTEMGSRLT